MKNLIVLIIILVPTLSSALLARECYGPYTVTAITDQFRECFRSVTLMDNVPDGEIAKEYAKSITANKVKFEYRPLYNEKRIKYCKENFNNPMLLNVDGVYVFGTDEFDSACALASYYPKSKKVIPCSK